MTDKEFKSEIECRMNDETVVVKSVNDIPKESLPSAYSYTLYNAVFSYTDIFGKNKKINTSFCFDQYIDYDGDWIGFVDKERIDCGNVNLPNFQGNYNNFDEVADFMSIKCKRNLKIIKEATLWYADQINLDWLIAKELHDNSVDCKRKLKVMKNFTRWIGISRQINLDWLIEKDLNSLTYQEILEKMPEYGCKNNIVDILDGFFGDEYKAKNPKFEKIEAIKHVVGYIQRSNQLALF